VALHLLELPVRGALIHPLPLIHVFSSARRVLVLVAVVVVIVLTRAVIAQPRNVRFLNRGRDWPIRAAKSWEYRGGGGGGGGAVGSKGAGEERPSGRDCLYVVRQRESVRMSESESDCGRTLLDK
jgi:hypothetical protein